MSHMPLTRNRRRMLMATVVVAGCVIGYWSMRPRIDSRLVGVWIESERFNSQIEFRLVDFERTVLTLKADGTGAWSHGGHFRWTVDNNRIRFVTVRNKYAGIFPTPVLDLYASLSGSPLHSVSVYKIVDVTVASLTILSLDAALISRDRIEPFPMTFDRAME
jgi:hypothetical protein